VSRAENPVQINIVKNAIENQGITILLVGGPPTLIKGNDMVLSNKQKRRKRKMTENKREEEVNDPDICPYCNVNESDLGWICTPCWLIYFN
jgi:hypothetical protein